MNNNVGVFIISGFFYLSLIIITIMIVYSGVKFYFKKRKLKKAYFLLTEKYEILSYDKDGIPTFMKKGENIEQI